MKAEQDPAPRVKELPVVCLYKTKWPAFAHHAPSRAALYLFLFTSTRTHAILSPWGEVSDPGYKQCTVVVAASASTNQKRSYVTNGVSGSRDVIRVSEKLQLGLAGNRGRLLAPRQEALHGRMGAPPSSDHASRKIRPSVGKNVLIARRWRLVMPRIAERNTRVR